MRTILEIEPLVRSRRELLDDGISDFTIRRALQKQELIKLRAGVYMCSADWASIKPWEEYYVRVLAFHKGTRETVFSHHSAAALHQLALINTRHQKVHIYCRVSSRGSTQGASRHVKLNDQTPVTLTATGANATHLLTTLLDCSQAMPFVEAMVVVESALHQGKVSLGETQNYLFEFTGRCKRRVHKVAMAIGGKSESPGETLTKIRLEALGIRYIQQYEVYLGGFVYRADFYLPDYGVFIEFDGAIKYQNFYASPEVAIQQERAREREFLNSGARIFRATWDMVFKNPQRFDAQLRAFLG